MQILATYFAVAFVAGWSAHVIRLPPMVGFLAAGFALNAAGVEHLPLLDVAANMGVTLLLFAVGLSLDVRSLVRKEVLVTATAHMALSVALAMGFLLLCSMVGFSLLKGVPLSTLLMLAFALSFSSTVFAVKVLDGRSDAQALYGRVAIGILVMQDIAAVFFITYSNGKLPSLWAFGLVLLFPAAWVAQRVMNRMGHGELPIVFAVTMAFGGYAVFEQVGLKGDLGAVVVGMLLASHPKASELSQQLFGFKELLLVAFFVSIGFTGLPNAQMLALGVCLLLLLPVQTVGYMAFFHLTGLRHRTSILAGLSLANFSEFALIVAAIGVNSDLLGEGWLVVLAVAVAFSFVLSTLINLRGTSLASKLSHWLPEQRPDKLHEHDRPIDVENADAVVLGMGRVGSTSYRQLHNVYGMHVVGVEHKEERVTDLLAKGLNVVEGDATDEDFWAKLCGNNCVQLIILAMPFHGSNLVALRESRKSGFTGKVVAVARYEDEINELQREGVDDVIHIYSGVGTALADSAALVVGHPDAHSSAASDEYHSSDKDAD